MPRSKPIPAAAVDERLGRCPIARISLCVLGHRVPQCCNLEQLIQAAAQMADDDPRLVQARELIRLRIIARVRQADPILDQANWADVVARVFKNLEKVMRWVDENGMPIGNDEPVIRDALLSELRMVLCTDQTWLGVD